MEPSWQQQVYEVVRCVPAGKVATYGQVAALLGYPRHARQVGFALANLGEDHDVPWHRVINSKGEVSTRESSDYENHQRWLLEDEGVIFNENGRIKLKTFQWSPD